MIGSYPSSGQVTLTIILEVPLWVESSLRGTVYFRWPSTACSDWLKTTTDYEEKRDSPGTSPRSGGLSGGEIKRK